jgi:hypothetical protein
MDNGTDTRPPRIQDNIANASTNAKTKKNDGTASAGGHRRTISGSLLSSLSFLRSSNKEANREREAPVEDGEGDDGPKRGLSIATALRQSQGRKRRGSLRKAAMFGTSKVLRERGNSLRKDMASAKATATNAQIRPLSPDDDDGDDDDEATPRRFSYENASLNSSSDNGWPTSPGKLSMSTSSSRPLEPREHVTPRAPAEPLMSPVGIYASTTDDDEGLSFFRPSASSSGPYSGAQLQSVGVSSSVQRRRSNRSTQHSSLTIVHTPADSDLDDEWDYSETEWWGWVVLIATWIVFVVGMGSCLGVWSWAWDVGETPYAPPELEDDPTLPITGYYPALMVCTAVMAWVWVVVAWVGMKYFRHAKAW